jgi:hypothetical protein
MSYLTYMLTMTALCRSTRHIFSAVCCLEKMYRVDRQENTPQKRCVELIDTRQHTAEKLCRVDRHKTTPLCREPSRFVNLRGKLFSRRLARGVDKSGCFPTQWAVIVLLYFCQCFIGYLPCGGKLGCSAGNNRVYSLLRKESIACQK